MENIHRRSKFWTDSVEDRKYMVRLLLEWKGFYVSRDYQCSVRIVLETIAGKSISSSVNWGIISNLQAFVIWYGAYYGVHAYCSWLCVFCSTRFLIMPFQGLLSVADLHWGYPDVCVNGETHSLAPAGWKSLRLCPCRECARFAGLAKNLVPDLQVMR